jgi:hypothetical protein
MIGLAARRSRPAGATIGCCDDDGRCVDDPNRRRGRSGYDGLCFVAPRRSTTRRKKTKAGEKIGCVLNGRHERSGCVAQTTAFVLLRLVRQDARKQRPKNFRATDSEFDRLPMYHVVRGLRRASVRVETYRLATGAQTLHIYVLTIVYLTSCWTRAHSARTILRTHGFTHCTAMRTR